MNTPHMDEDPRTAIPRSSVPAPHINDEKGSTMMTRSTDTTPDVPLPPGAVPPYDWESGLTPADPKWRCIWSPPMEESIDVRCVVTQYLDGTIANEGDDAPLVYIGCDDFLTDDARAIAKSIIAAADLADRWAGR